MDWRTASEVSTDFLQEELTAGETEIARIRARQVDVLQELDRRQAHTGDGCRSLSQWVSLVLDTTLDEARSLVRTMRRTTDRPDLREALATGTSFRRIEALSKITEEVGLLEHEDVASILRLAARKARITASEEARTVDDRFLVMQPSLDQSWWRLWGGVDGYAGEIIDKTLATMADQVDMPRDHPFLGAGWRKATALVDLCLGKEAPKSEISVFVTAREATQTSGESGVVLASGTKIGRQTLEAVLCDAPVEVFGVSSQGEYMRYGRKYRFATAAQTKALWHKYGGRCAADGCDSRNRLQAHHLRPWADGGETNIEALSCCVGSTTMSSSTSGATRSTTTPPTDASDSDTPRPADPDRARGSRSALPGPRQGSCSEPPGPPRL